MKEVVIVAAKRTAVGNFGGSLAHLSAQELGAVVIADLMNVTKLSPDRVDEVIIGEVLTAGVGQNPARQAAIRAGLPIDVPCLTINQVCGSGLKAVHLAAQSIFAGENEIVIAGGQESMSNAPFLLPAMRKGRRMGNTEVVDSMVHDGLTDAYNHYHMGITAENIAEKYGVSREDQDALALSSQQKAAAAQAASRFESEIVPVRIPQKKGDDVIFSRDEYVKSEASKESLAKLKPAFKKDGTVTAGNASGINDGAAAVMLMSREKASALGLPAIAKIKAMASVGLEPELMGMGPVRAIKKVLQKANWQVEDVNLFETNEAFAAQAVAVARELGLDMARVNVNGGAIAIGHPIGASGCRILVTLLHEMQRRGAKKGVAALCIGGGMGVALALELAEV